MTGRLLAEGSRDEAKDVGLAKIKEKALLRSKELQGVDDDTEVSARAGKKVAMADPEATPATESATPSVLAPASPSEAPADAVTDDAVVIKSDAIDAKTARRLDQSFRKAHALAKSGKVGAAKNLFLNICQAGHAHACHKFAWYEELAGNTANATRFYRAACDNGLGKSCNNLAFQFEQKKDYDKALDLYARGCKDKHEASCKSLKRIREEQRQDTPKAR